MSQTHSSESEILEFKSWFDFCFQSQPRSSRAGNHEVSKAVIYVSVSLGKETGPLPGSVQGAGCSYRVRMGGRMELHLPEMDTRIQSRRWEWGILTPEEAKIWPGGWACGVGGKVPVVSSSHPSLSPCFSLAPSKDVCLPRAFRHIWTGDTTSGRQPRDSKARI